MERELKKLKMPAARIPLADKPAPARRRVLKPVGEDGAIDSALKLETYLTVAKGEITRLDYIVTQFLQAIRPSPPQLKPASLNDVVTETLELLQELQHPPNLILQ